MCCACHIAGIGRSMLRPLHRWTRRMIVFVVTGVLMGAFYPAQRIVSLLWLGVCSISFFDLIDYREIPWDSRKSKELDSSNTPNASLRVIIMYLSRFVWHAAVTADQYVLYPLANKRLYSLES